jgi:hypothetical protein
VTEYSTDGGATWLPYTTDVSVTNEGVTTVLYRSTDRAGNIETAQSVTIKLDKTAPIINLSASPTSIWPPDGRTVNVTISGDGSDAASGLSSVSYAVSDEYGSSLAIPARTLSGASATWEDVLGVEASRNGEDLDGRLYRVTATLTDAAGHTSTVSVDIIVPHDQRP